MICKAIFTRYRGPTNCRGSKIVAKASDNSARSYGIKHSLGIDDMHCLAAMEYAKARGWSGFYRAGALPDGLVFVSAASDINSWKHGSALVDFARTYDSPLGKEGRDWFWIAGENSAHPSTEIVCHD